MHFGAGIRPYALTGFRRGTYHLRVKSSSAIALACTLAALLAPATGRADGAFRAVLVIDASSSMRRTDPGELRKVAAELFVDLARDGDRMAVTGFDGSVRQSTGDFIAIDGIDTRRQLKEAIRAVGNDGQWTDFTAGLREARRILDSAPRGPGDQDLVVFLTDGKCEPDPEGPEGPDVSAKSAGSKGPRTAVGGTPAEREAACQAEVLNRIAGELSGARVYAIGLSRKAPAAFLEELGRRTGGRGVVTLDPQELPRLFAGVYAGLLGSRLQEGSAQDTARFAVYEGAESLDVVLVGRTPTSERLLDPDGREIAIDNRAPARVYFAGSAQYRFYKIARPRPGEWTMALPGKGSRAFATLQHFDMELALVEPPAVVEQGRDVVLRARLRTRGGAVPPADFLDRHRLFAMLAAPSPSNDEDGDELRIALARGADGTFTGSHTPEAMGTWRVRLVLEPGPDGMLQRDTGVLASISVIPPVHLAAAPVDLGPVRQAVSIDAIVSMAGSELGVPVEVELATDAAWLTLSPQRFTLTASGGAAGNPAGRDLALRFTVAGDAPAGAARPTLSITPITPAGFPGTLDDRALAVPVSIDVVPLTFWERYGRLVQYGAAALVAIVLLLGWLTPARFKKRAILYYKDVRDPELPRQSSYPVGVKAGAGFFRPARVHMGPSGPVKRGGVVVLEAAGGGAIEARPLSAGATVRKASIADDDDAFGGNDDERPRVPLRKGGFRMAPGTGYEIEGSGLVFWYK